MESEVEVSSNKRKLFSFETDEIITAITSDEDIGMGNKAGSQFPKLSSTRKGAGTNSDVIKIDSKEVNFGNIKLEPSRTINDVNTAKIDENFAEKVKESDISKLSIRSKFFAKEAENSVVAANTATIDSNYKRYLYEYISKLLLGNNYKNVKAKDVFKFLHASAWDEMLDSKSQICRVDSISDVFSLFKVYIILFNGFLIPDLLMKLKIKLLKN